MIKRLVILLLSVTVSACAVLDPQHLITRHIGNHANPDDQPLSLATKTDAFDFVWNRINEAYVDPQFRGIDWNAVGEQYRPIIFNVNSDDSFWKQLDFMTAELGDAHTRVLSAKQYRSIKAKQAFTLGLDVAVLDQESGQESGQKLGQELIVTGVAQDSSAQAAGIAKGDKLLLIDGEDALDWWYRHGQVVRKNSTERAKLSSLKRLLNIGDPDHPSDAVELKIERKDGSFFEQKLVRTLLSRKDSVNALVLPSGFGYLRLTGFDAQLANAVQRAFKILQFTPGLIIDLRGNSGGSEALSFAMMDELLAGPVKVGKHVTRNGKPPSLFFGMIAVSKLDLVLEGSERPYTAPVVVLLDAGSASASELFAGTLQGMGRVSVIGQTSCGCLLVYYGYANVPGGGALAYSESDFAPVYGQRIEGRGVLPDIAVVNRRADLLAGRDQVLLTAEKFLDQKRSEKSAALSLMNLPNLN